MELKKIPLVVKLYNYYKTIRYNQNLVIKEVFNYNKSRFYNIQELLGTLKVRIWLILHGFIIRLTKDWLCMICG